MDVQIQRLLNDRVYDKRKYGALELERVIREALAAEDDDKVSRIIRQLCHEFAYAVHQPHARNGGLIGLAAASIALGGGVAKYLEEIVPPVLACFTDPDARVRYYACEAMYNIAKVAKGEILIYFNEVFDALSKLAADSELSVKNGAELLDRLIKDIVAVSATTYISVIQHPDIRRAESTAVTSDTDEDEDEDESTLSRAFNLARFIPLLTDRMHVLNPFTRNFLTSWITLLDSVPDLELVSHLPAFLGGLFKFLSDTNQDVQVATQTLLDKFLNEIKRVARVKQGIEESRKGHGDDKSTKQPGSPGSDSLRSGDGTRGEPTGSIGVESDSTTAKDGPEGNVYGDWVPGQDVHVDHSRILEILVSLIDAASEEEIRLAALRWIVVFFDICPEDILPFVPRLLAQVLPAMSSEVDLVRQVANRVNTALMGYIVSLAEETESREAPPSTRLSNNLSRELVPGDRRDSTPTGRSQASTPRDMDRRLQDVKTPDIDSRSIPSPAPQTTDLDYAAAVASLTLHFLNEHEATRVAALSWLLMLHRKAPRKVLAINDGTFPALLKTLSDPAEAVVTRDLQLLSQISRNSDDDYFYSFMVSLLQLFSTDRRLLETRGNLIIRQLCMNLSAERIYRTLAECLEKDEDAEFASIMVQNLNNNLITAPELGDLRRRLRNLETREGQLFFVALFRSWCHNAVATFSLCLLAQAYEQAYSLLQIFADLEMDIEKLIQIDKLVQLLESPVFTYLRLQLLEPEKYPNLYKCLYGLLMLLPQSSAFALLKNRLNSVSAIGLLQIGPRQTASSAPTTYDRGARLKGRDDSGIRWSELTDKFRAVQEKAARQVRLRKGALSNVGGLLPDMAGLMGGAGLGFREHVETSQMKPLPVQATGLPAGGAQSGLPVAQATPPAGHTKNKSSFSRFGGAVADARKRVRRPG
ncbi:MAG: hypothetical protein M1814_001365 [Vezdaea aestivalis]|nr:MAG: hypothetical protein M1814_001365 [Vezdaea aestivalis]